MGVNISAGNLMTMHKLKNTDATSNFHNDQYHNRKVASSNVGPAGIAGGSECTEFSIPQYHDEVPLSKKPNTQLLPGRRSKNGCPLLRVCVHGVCVYCCVCALCIGKMQSTNSEYGLPYLAVCHVTFIKHQFFIS